MLLTASLGLLFRTVNTERLALLSFPSFPVTFLLWIQITEFGSHIFFQSQQIKIKTLNIKVFGARCSSFKHQVYRIELFVSQLSSLWIFRRLVPDPNTYWYPYSDSQVSYVKRLGI